MASSLPKQLAILLMAALLLLGQYPTPSTSCIPRRAFGTAQFGAGGCQERNDGDFRPDPAGTASKGAQGFRKAYPTPSPPYGNTMKSQNVPIPRPGAPSTVG